ncbi:LexA family transcriptional regulator [Rouxiella sp. WC2420]|uniref:LexA family transcriptional regulator n=1 Tax=Rouxiella sp. WC2420 TaxID=3234145 RepID=A0AB39VN86_9GAMM
MNILTEQQGKVLEFIAGFIEKNHFPPTRTEIADHLGFRSANAADEHVKGLVRKG